MIGKVDIPRLVEIRALVRENKLRDPPRVAIEDICWFIDNPGIFVWVEDKIVGIRVRSLILSGGKMASRGR